MGSNPGTVYWMDIFSHIFVAKICNVSLKRPKINEKEAGVGPFLKKQRKLATRRLSASISGGRKIDRKCVWRPYQIEAQFETHLFEIPPCENTWDVFLDLSYSSDLHCNKSNWILMTHPDFCQFSISCKERRRMCLSELNRSCCWSCCWPMGTCLR